MLPFHYPDDLCMTQHETFWKKNNYLFIVSTVNTALIESDEKKKFTSV